MNLIDALKALPPTLRQTVYVLAFLVFTVLTGISLFGHDWLQVALYVFSMFGFGTAASNVNRPQE